MSSKSSTPYIKTSINQNVGIITLNRPDALNALCKQLIVEMSQALSDFDRDDDIGAIVLTGNEKAFAAGADISEMQSKTYMGTLLDDFFGDGWEQITHCRTPVVAAVAGYALGGGCELAMMCDFIIAAESARFAQPEIKLGTIPGLGGTQRLTRLVGKAKAMEMCLTGRIIDANEAERAGLVARVVTDEKLLDEAITSAQSIAEKSRPSVLLCKEAVNTALETTLTEGIRFERRLFYSLFASEDQKEGMQAFLDKRKPKWKHR